MDWGKRHLETSHRHASFGLAVLILGVQSLLLTARFSYRAVISVDPVSHSSGVSSSSSSPSLPSTTEDATRQAADAVARSVDHLGLIADPRFETNARDSRESSEIDNIVIGLFRTNPDRDEWVEVRSVIQKQTGEFFVLIENRLSPFASELTRAIEAAIVSALQEAFPNQEIQAGSKVIGPALSP